MTKETESIYNQYYKENFIREKSKEIRVKEKFTEFLNEVVNDDVTIRDVKKVIGNTLDEKCNFFTKT